MPAVKPTRVEKGFFGEVDADWTEHGVPRTGVAGHSVRVKLKLPGDTTLSFKGVEAKRKAAAMMAR
ncbi:hypothetical protein [Rhizobium grahamii]|uniref:hypothetical protein n=1 Tax=Rhizobium grahamii TaxID=1120045 RepID=UPI0011B0EDE7|nr:hypothetical protein [Rhizobium grahamii]